MDYRNFTSADICALLNLAGELHRMPANLSVRIDHMMRGLCGLVHAQVGIFCELENYTSDQQWRIRPVLDFGWAGASERAWNMSFFDGDQLSDPMTGQCARLRDRVVTRSRSQVISDKSWYASANVNELRRNARIDHCIYSNYSLDGAGHAMGIALHRPWGDPPFGERDVALVDAFHRHQSIYEDWVDAARQTGRSLAPRLRQVLDWLQSGCSEKEVAARLCISRHTVHDYVKILYRHFNVSSRAELLSLWLDTRARRPAIRPSPASHSRLSFE